MLVSASFTEQRKCLSQDNVYIPQSFAVGFFSRERETGCDVYWFPVFHCSLQFSVLFSPCFRGERMLFSAPAEARCFSVIYQL